MSKRLATNRFLGLFLATVFFAGCASYRMNVREANRSFNAGDYDHAIQILEQELVQNPQNSELNMLLYRAKINSYYSHLAMARQAVTAGNKESAKAEYGRAQQLFPGNQRLQEEMDANLASGKKEEAAVKTTIQPPIQLNVDAKAKFDLILYNTSLTNIFKALGKNFNINFIFDREFRDGIQSVDIKNKNFLETLRMLCLVANAEYRIVDPTTVLVYPDQPYKKMLFDIKAIKTFYLAHTKAEDVLKVINPLFTAAGQGTQIQTDSGTNSLIVKADLNTLADIEKFLANIDIPKAEVEINIEIIEINRSLVRKLGATFGSPLLSAQFSKDVPTSTTVPISTQELNQGSFYLTIPSAAMNLLETDNNNKLIAKPNLRGIDGEKISYMVGDEIPIPNTTFGSFAAGGLNTVPTTSYTYKNVGVEIKITPFIHQNGETTLDTELTINFVSGTGVENFPTLGKREIKAKFRLKENETNLIGGFIRDDIRTSLAGIPALARIPILGNLFGGTQKTVDQTDLIFSITPRIIRKMPIKDKNLEPIWINIDKSSAGAAAAEGALPGRERSDMMGARPTLPQKNALVISPPQNRIPVGGETTFTVSIQSDSPLGSLSLHGTSQGAEITDLKADFFDNSVKVLKYFSGNSFDAGFTFSEASRPLQNSVVLQLKVKGTSRGSYAINVEATSALDIKQRSITLAAGVARIEVN